MYIGVCVMLADKFSGGCSSRRTASRQLPLLQRLLVRYCVVVIFLLLVDDVYGVIIDEVKSSAEQQLIAPSVSATASSGSASAATGARSRPSSLGLFNDIVDLTGRNQELQKSTSSLSNVGVGGGGGGSSSLLAWRKLTECAKDQNCINTNSICLNGNCVRVCSSNGNVNMNLSSCVYIHCDSKRIINARNYGYGLGSAAFNPLLLDRNQVNNEFTIETNNYPLLSRYLSKKKCAWILNYARGGGGGGDDERRHRFIQLKFERFATQLANDYLYIFAGDSVYAPLVAALSGPQMASDEPSRTADQEENASDIEAEPTENNTATTANSSNSDDDDDELEEESADYSATQFKLAPLNVTFFNLNTLFLLFKTDLTSSYSILNSFKTTRFNNKPAGISIKYKFSSSCYNEILCYNEALQAKYQTPDSINCSFPAEQQKCQSELLKKSVEHKLAETVRVESDHQETTVTSSPLRRASHCSFDYNGYMYVVGGFSFSMQPLSFVSRLNLENQTMQSPSPLSWEHAIDRKPSTVVNRSNRRFFGEPSFKSVKLDLPRARYAHACVLDRDNDHFYMFGGVVYDASDTKLPQNAYKETSNELWSYNLLTNKWTLLNDEFSSPNVTRKYMLPIGVSGHSMHLVERGAYGKSILIFFGYSEYYSGNLNLIQEYVLGSKTWLMHNTATSINIGYAHSSVLHSKSNTIYFHGGLSIKTSGGASTGSGSNEFFTPFIGGGGGTAASMGGFKSPLFSPDYSSPLDQFDSSPFFIGISGNAGTTSGGGGGSARFAQSISPHLYAFDITTFEWRRLPKSASHACYAHTMTLASSAANKLVFYGGICDSNRYGSQLFISNQLTVFDLRRQEWTTRFSQASSSQRFSIKLARRQRYAHSALVYNNRSLLVFAGFNGFFLNDLFRIDLERIGIEKNLTSMTNEGEANLRPPTLQRIRRFLPPSTSHNVKASPLVDLFFNRTLYSNAVSPGRLRVNDLFVPMSRTFNMTPPGSQQPPSPPIQLPCSRFSSCLSCHLDPNCIWHESQCEFYNNTAARSVSASTQSQSQPSTSSSSPLLTPVYKKPVCTQLCSEHTSCENCMSAITASSSSLGSGSGSGGGGGLFQSECVWCHAQAKCVLKRAVHVHFMFGECVYLTSDKAKCGGGEKTTPVVSNDRVPDLTSTFSHKNDDPSKANVLKAPTIEKAAISQLPQASLLIGDGNDNSSTCASEHTNCSSCIQDIRCGWCSSDQLYTQGSSLIPANTGLGVCLEGGQDTRQRCTLNWFYSECPPCECNGHSQCSGSANASPLSVTASPPSFQLLAPPSPPISSVAASLLAVDPNGLVCAQPCSNNTQGEFCHVCADGYFGQAENGGTCAPCECGQQASLCDSRKGTCFCNTKGVIGSKCDQCDTPRYTGRPDLPDGTCFYNLTTDYQFTFNLNKDSDSYYTRINFVNHIAAGMDDDLDFMVRCYRDTAYINVSYVAQYVNYDDDDDDDGDLDENDRLASSQLAEIEWPFDLIENLSYLWSNLNANYTAATAGGRRLLKKKLLLDSMNRRYYFGPMSQHTLLTRINCTTNELKYVFYNRDLNYADKNRNFMFVVYVYDFQTPITVQVAFSRRTRVQLLHFFITFFGCLLSLLTIAFITWKSKQRYDRYRHQRQIVMQMEHMASRPFTRLFIDVVNGDDKEKLMMQAEQALNQNKVLNRSESNRSTTSFGGSGRRFLNSIKSSLKLGGTGSAASGSVKSRPASGGTDSSESDSAAATDLMEDKQRLISAAQVEQMRRKFKLMPVAVEPLSNQKSAIVTCMLKLPHGGLSSTPKGSSPFVLCSSYVQLVSAASSLVNFTHLETDEPPPPPLPPSQSQPSQSTNTSNNSSSSVPGSKFNPNQV